MNELATPVTPAGRTAEVQRRIRAILNEMDLHEATFMYTLSGAVKNGLRQNNRALAEELLDIYRSESPDPEVQYDGSARLAAYDEADKANTESMRALAAEIPRWTVHCSQGQGQGDSTVGSHPSLEEAIAYCNEHASEASFGIKLPDGTWHKWSE